MSSAPNSLASDIYFTSINDSGIIEELLAKPAPLGPREEVRQMVRGFVAGADALPGSNSISLGAVATRSGGGINVANPHLWWDSEMRWWQTQLSLPGKLDVSGAEQIGMPLVVMGHTDSVAWSITTAEEARITLLCRRTPDPDPRRL